MLGGYMVLLLIQINVLGLHVSTMTHVLKELEYMYVTLLALRLDRIELASLKNVLVDIKQRLKLIKQSLQETKTYLQE